MLGYTVIVLPCVTGELSIGQWLGGSLLEALGVGGVVIVLVVHHVLVAEVLIVRVKQVVVALLDLVLEQVGFAGSDFRS